MRTRCRIRAALSILTLVVSVPCFGCRRARPDAGEAPPRESAQTQPAQVSAAPSGKPQNAHYPSPELDLPADRLSERVDGAEVKLRALGCSRLLYWRIKQPPADLEVLRFASDDGAKKMLTEQAGTERTPGTPGDEGWAGTNVVYFRRGSVYVRLVADGPEPRAALMQPAEKIERALSSGEVKP